MVRVAEPLDRLVRLGHDQVQETAALLGTAFQQDPLFVHVCPDPDHRARWLPWMFLWPIWWGLRRGEVLGTAGRLDGVAIVVPSSADGEDEQVAQLARRDRAEREREVSPAEIEAWLRYDSALQATMESGEEDLHRVASGPHLYLAVLGVEPTRQGMGIGSRLLRAVSARADALQLPLTLITCQPRNLVIYGRHGYEVVCEGTAADGGLRWWGMRRNSRTSTAGPVTLDER